MTVIFSLNSFFPKKIEPRKWNKCLKKKKTPEGAVVAFRKQWQFKIIWRDSEYVLQLHFFFLRRISVIVLPSKFKYCSPYYLAFLKMCSDFR